MTLGANSADAYGLQCMEIWGGNDAVERAVSTPGLDAWVYSRPFDGAEDGGDVHYVSLCGGGIITRLIVADVSGHGAAVAEVAATLRSLMRRNINTKSQTRLVRAMNEQFTSLAQTSRFATAIVATYLATNDRLTICNAGHPRPFWYRARSSSWSVVSAEALGGRPEAGNLPLGLDDETPYDQFWLQLGQGDTVVFYTDALTESESPEGTMLGERGALNLLHGLETSDPSSLGHALLRALDEYRGGRPADDDTTLLILHHNAGPPKRMSFGEKVTVYAKVFGLKSV